ncbi:MAG: tetratricopeptide repeat protein [Deltaproteobacteria bacterium]|nr:tetratricopeptide repeat protein [Deltaproteobacteria bacterium]
MKRWPTIALGLWLAAIAAPAGAEGDSISPADLKLLQEIEELLRHFEEQNRSYRKEVQDLVERQYQERRQQVIDQYERQIAELEKAERARRDDAIARFEDFLRHYPNDPVFTPDAMFRLAELYFERSNDAYLAATREFDQQIKAYDRGEIKVEPEQPQPHYEQSIALYQRMITDFPGYRLIDGAYYLLGYCLSEQGEQEAGLKTFMELTARFPQSRFFTEAWMRIGESYFDSDRLTEAADAYTRVVQGGPGNKLYDRGLYKLAWTHYRLDMFPEAIGEFMALVDFADVEKIKGNTEAQALRPESLQYIAVSFADERWDRGIGYDFELDETGEQMIDFAIAYFEKIGHRSYERDVVTKLGNILFDSAKYPGAVKALRYALDQDPLSPEAPKTSQRIVEAWERARQFDQAAASRDELFGRYAEGTDWFKANQGNPKALADALELTKTSLYTSAIFHHQQAQKYWNDQKLDLAKNEYALAAVGYQKYLDRFPHDKDAYELGYYLADCYFYSLDFVKAADAFGKVRDSAAGAKYKTDAALNVVFSLDEEIKRLEKAGKLETRKVLTGAERGDQLPKPEPIPELRKRLADACDAFVAVAPKHERVAEISYKAAEIYYLFHHYEVAKTRFERIIEQFPTTDVAKYAANLIIEYLLALKNWGDVEKFAQVVQKKKIGDATEYKKFEVGALFNKAKQWSDEGEKLLAEGKVREGNQKLEAGAREYVRLVTENPRHEFADKALFNAAVAYERTRRFDSAARLYERVFREYPKSELADKALFLVALKSEQAFDFAKAIENYLKLVHEYPESPDRANAQFNAALALENTQDYQRAASEYERYASMFADREDAPETFYRAGVVHEKRGDEAAMVATFQKFIRKYQRDPRQSDRVLEALVKIADHYYSSNQLKEAKSYYEQAVREFANRRLSTASVGGYNAAKARFFLVEMTLPAYEGMKIQGTGKQQQKALKDKAEKLQVVEDLYREVLNYKQIEWSLAALYRMGYVYENLAETLLKAECPKDVKRLGQEYCDEYTVQIEDQAAKLEEKIVPAYELAFKEAKNAKVINDWTKRTLEGLNKYRKAEYPIDKEPRSSLVETQDAGTGLVVPEELASKLGAGKRLEGK